MDMTMDMTIFEINDLEWKEVCEYLLYGHSNCSDHEKDEIAIAVSSFGAKWWEGEQSSRFVPDEDCYSNDGWDILRDGDATQVHIESCTGSVLEAELRDDGTWSVTAKFPLDEDGNIASKIYWPLFAEAAGIHVSRCTVIQPGRPPVEE